jgi:hypothetical protein
MFGCDIMYGDEGITGHVHYNIFLPNIYDIFTSGTHEYKTVNSKATTNQLYTSQYMIEEQK